MLAAYLEYINF